MSATSAPQAEFQDAGKPLAQPVYQVDTSGNPINSADGQSVTVVGALPAGTNLIGAVSRSAVAVYSLASTATTSSSDSGDLIVGPYTEIGIDINTTAQTGTNPTIQFFWKRKGADGIYYALWQSAVLTAATNTISTSIGAGMAYNQSLGSTGKLTWTIGGTSTPGFTFSANIYGK